jgi:Cleft lip and palate transmembrane protein 1 (CLPTM1)
MFPDADFIPSHLTVETDVHLVPGKRDETGTKGYYNPIIFPNEFWHLRSQYVEINATTPTLPLQVVFQPMSYFKFQVIASMTFGFQEAAKQQGGSSTAELDEMKRMLIETNPWFLGLTGLVSVLHVVSVGQVLLSRFLIQFIGLSSWHSSQMSLTGERKKNLQVFPSGMHFSDICSITIDFTNAGRYISILSVTRCACPNSVAF